MTKKRKPDPDQWMSAPDLVNERELGYYEGAMSDLVLDLAEGLGRMMDESLGDRTPEIEQIIIGVAYRDEIGEGTAWKPLYGNRWTSTRGLVDAIQDNLSSGMGSIEELLGSVRELLARLQR